MCDVSVGNAMEPVPAGALETSGQVKLVMREEAARTMVTLLFVVTPESAAIVA